MIIVKLIPLILLLGIITFIIYTVLKGNKSSAFYYAITILFISGLLYYMIVFLNYEILGTYSLTNLNKYDKQLLEAKANLDSFDNKRKQILDEINKAKNNLEVQLDKIVVYTSEAAKTNLEMQRHLEKQKEIEQTIMTFDSTLADITQELLKISFLTIFAPKYISGEIAEAYMDELENITKQIGPVLGFDPDSFLNQVYNIKTELDKKL